MLYLVLDRVTLSSLLSDHACVYARFSYKKLDVTCSSELCSLLYFTGYFFLQVSGFPAWQGKSSR